MKKAELIKLPVLNRDTKREKQKHLLMAHKELLKDESEVLVIEVYYSLNQNPNYRIFLTKTDDITLVCTGQQTSWKTGVIYQYTSWYREDEFLEDEESNNIIKEFCNGRESEQGCRMIVNHQNMIREMRLNKRYKKITDPWDKVMETVPIEPSDFRDWITETAMHFSRYIFYQYTGKETRKGWCTHCCSEVEITGVKNGSSALCPCCKSEVYLRASGKLKYLTDEKDIFLMQRIKDRLLIREYTARRNFRKDEQGWEIENSLYEKKRIFFNSDGEVEEAYKYECFKQRNMQWIKLNSASLYWVGRGALYSNNLNDILSDTKYKHSGLKCLAEYEPGFEFNIGRFLEDYDDYMFIEYLIKNNLCKIARDFINGEGRSACSRYATRPGILNEDASTLGKLLRIEKYDIKFLQENKANITGLEYLQDRRKKGQKPIPEHMEFIQTIFKDRLDEFNKFMKYAKPGKVIKYLKNNKRISLGSKKGYVELWKDYLQMAERLGYDLTNDFVMFPRYLKLRHDQCIEEINAERAREKVKALKKENIKVKKRYEGTLQKYQMEYKDLIIVVPKAAEDIIKEGHDMHHCVGGYVSSVAQGKTTILFIRKKDKPSKSYYTMEVQNNEVKQCRGKYNAGMTPDVIAFVQKFKKEILKQRRKAS